MTINEILPLNGKKILLTRTEEQAKESIRSFEEAGAEVILFPVIEISEPESWADFDSILSERKFEFIIFTSANAAGMFARRVETLCSKLNYPDYKIAAVGRKTAETCHKLGIPVNIIPEEFSGIGVLKALTLHNIKNKNVFIPRSAIASNELEEGLIKEGASVTSAIVYDVKTPSSNSVKKKLDVIKNEFIDLVIFTSPSTFNNFLQIAGINDPAEYFSTKVVAAIGRTTRSAIEKTNVRVSIVPEEQTMNGLFEAIKDFYLKQYTK